MAFLLGRDAHSSTLQRELVALAGWPSCTEAYAKNLREAESWAALQGNGLALMETLAEVSYREELLAAAETSVGDDGAISLGLADDR